jgi:hypothetical protein
MKTYSRHDFTREERAARAKVAISAAFESKDFRTDFLDKSSAILEPATLIEDYRTSNAAW